MKRLKLRGKITIALVMLLVVAVLGNAIWSSYTQQAQAKLEMREKAQILTSEMNAVWDFMDINQDRIDTDSDGTYNFKGLYCAIAGKSIAKLLERETDYLIQYVSLQPRKKASLADEFETEAIHTFLDSDIREVYGMGTLDGYEVYRYITPIYLKKSCLECHGGPVGELDVTGYAKEGMAEGDLVGVTSISMPMDIYMQGVRDNITREILYSTLMMLLVIGVVYFCVTRWIIRPLTRVENAVEHLEGGDFDLTIDSVGGTGEIQDLAKKFDFMAGQLKSLYGNLEEQVETRTMQLEAANEMLEHQRGELARMNEELFEENRYQSEFFAIMSHELRTPLTAIIAFTDIWEASNMDHDESELAAVKEIKENGHLLLNMVNNILEMARAEAGRGELVLEEFDMVDMISITEGTMAFLAERKGITFSTDICPSVPIIKADWEKIRRIIENLVSNATKFTQKGGSVSIDIDYEAEEDLMIIRVSDTGIGITDEDLPYIFEKYTQRDKSSHRRYRGSGLGLAVVSDLVAMHGGTVEVSSVYKQGSVFTVYIPAHSEKG